jgi:hypothetical protein
MPTKGKDKLVYVTLRVNRRLTPKEQAHIDQMDDLALKKWEVERYTSLFKIAVRAKDEKSAIKSLKKMLKSELVIEKDNGKEVPATKHKT